jgi:hypothetical protein
LKVLTARDGCIAAAVTDETFVAVKSLAGIPVAIGSQLRAGIPVRRSGTAIRG